MSELLPSLVSLDKGLNLQTAKVVAEPGSVLDALNYEQVDFQGQKRIEGFSRYDGHVLATINDYYVITVNANFLGSGQARLYSNDNFFGMLVDSNSSSPILYAVSVNDNFIPEAGDTLSYRNVSNDPVEYTVVSVALGSAVAADADEHYAKLLEYSANMRARVQELPGPVAGLHWFRDRLYAVAGVTAASLSGTSPVIHPNDVLTLGGLNYNVLDAYVLDNTRLVFVDAFYPEDWQIEGTPVTRNAVSMGTIANGYEDLTTELTSFFEARTEAQVIAEDGIVTTGDTAGWLFKHLGWAVPFEDGTSLFGSLPALNQNIEGVGIEGPTSTTGEAGRPLVLKQNVSIADYQAQVSGWKSSNTPTTYELDADNLTDVDSLYIYADAFIEWDGDTGVVSAPGATSSTLTQYSATATVEVEV